MLLKCFVYRYMYDVDKIVLFFIKDLDLDYLIVIYIFWFLIIYIFVEVSIINNSVIIVDFFCIIMIKNYCKLWNI